MQPERLRSWFIERMDFLSGPGLALWVSLVACGCHRSRVVEVDTGSLADLCAFMDDWSSFFGSCFAGDPGCVTVICAGACVGADESGDWGPQVVGPIVVPYDDLMVPANYCANLDMTMDLELCTPDGEVCDPGDPDAPCPEDWYARVACLTGEEP